MNKSRICRAAAFIGLLALLAGPVWKVRHQPLFGDSYDDALYFSGAKALASGSGYRMPSFPGQPWEVKYPPLYPLYLSIAWRLQPSFPACLSVAAALQAALLPLLLLLVLLTLRRLGFGWRKCFLLAALMMSALVFVEMATTLFSEVLFLCLLLASILTVERAMVSPRAAVWAAGGGLLAGAACLTRTAGLPLLAAVPIFCFLRKRRPLAFVFLALALPAVVAWHVWTDSHAASGDVSYVQEYLRAIHSDGGFIAHLQTQIGGLASAAAEDFSSDIIGALHGVPVYPLFVIAGIAGLVRLGRRRRWPLLLIFALLYLPMLISWWYHDMARLLLPAWAALLAGLAAEAEHFASLPRDPLVRRKFRWALAAIAAGVVILNEHAAFTFVSSALARRSAEQPREREAFAWIRAHAEAGDVLLAWKDGLSWFYTGVPASRLLFAAATHSAPPVPVPPEYRRGLLLLMTSELDGGDDRLRLATLRGVGDRVAGAHLVYASTEALIYTVPLPSAQLSAVRFPPEQAHP